MSARPTARPILSVCLLACALFLAGCQGADPVKLNEQITKGNYGRVINKTEKLLAKTPTDPTLNALLLKARLLQCAETNCTSNPEFVPENFSAPAALATETQLEDGTKLSALLIHEEAAPLFAALLGQPAPTLAIMATAPDAAKSAYPNALFAQVQKNLEAAQNTPAIDLLTILTKSTTLAPAIKNVAGLLLGKLQQQPSLAEGYAIALRNDKDATIPPASAQLYMYLLSKQPGYPAKTLAELTTIKIPALLKTSSLQAMAQQVNKTTPAGNAGIEHMALSLTLNPAQTALWETFLPLAEADATADADASYFANLSQFAPLPPEVQARFLTSIFKLIETRSAAKQSILPLLQAVGQIKLDKVNETRLEKLVQTGLQTAITADNVEEVLAYARFRPTIAQAARQDITPLMVTTMRTDLQKEQFDRVTDLGIALEDIGIDFDMDALLLQELQENFKVQNLAEKLSATDPEWLLKQPSAARIELGALFGFAQTYFEDKPDVLTSQLKNLAISARGAYGLPSALYRIDSYFDDTSYPKEQRDAYLAAAIAKAVAADTSRTPAQLMDVVSQLAVYHQGINLPPLISSLLARATELPQARELWQAAGGQAREILGRTHAQFTALMKAIDAMEAKNYNAAAEALNELETPAYAEMARPYVTTLREKLSTMVGVYAARTPDMPAGAPAFIVLEAPALAGVADLSLLNATFFNALGTDKNPNPKTLETDHAAIFPQDVATTVDFTGLTLSPQNGASPLFSRLTLLPSGTGDLTLTWQNGKTTNSYTRILHNPADSLPVVGSFSVTKAVPTATMLPEGSIIEISGDKFALTGKIWHPASTSPLPATVIADPATFTTRLSFGYPLPASSQPAFAEVKCQILPGFARCGAHHRHSAREQFAALVQGAQTTESEKATITALEAANAKADADMTKDLPKLPVIAGNIASSINAMGAATSTTSLIQASSATDLLAAPVLTDEASGTTVTAPASVSGSTVSATTTSFTAPGVMLVPDR